MDKPYRMQSILQSLLRQLTADEILHDVKLVFTASLKSTRVMENITAMNCEDQLVLGIVISTLQVGVLTISRH